MNKDIEETNYAMNQKYILKMAILAKWLGLIFSAVAAILWFIAAIQPEIEPVTLDNLGRISWFNAAAAFAACIAAVAYIIERTTDKGGAGADKAPTIHSGLPERVIPDNEET